MYLTTTRRSILTLVVLASIAGAARAQCPDGTPPPCRRAGTAPARAVAVDENLIAIFPFRISGTSPEASSLREGAMDLLSLALDEQAGLRVVASRTLLARARTFTDASSVADAAAIARSLGAGAMILGNAVLVGNQVRARAELHDLVRNRPPVSVEARGLTADPAPVVDSLAFSLARLRLTSGSGTVRRSLTEFASTSPAALRLYLAGERLARHGLWQESADSLMAAVGLDSSFALALYRLRVVASYGATIAPWTATTLMERALRSLGRLPRRQGDLLQTAYAQVEGDARAAIARAEALGSRYPDDPEVAYEQGEAFYHVGLAFGVTPERALEPFDRAIRLDSTLIDPYNHAVELRVVTGDTAGALALARRGAALGPRSTVHQAALFAVRAIALHEPAATLAAEADRSTAAGDVVERTAYEVGRMLTADPARALRIEKVIYAAGAAPTRSPVRRALSFTYLACVNLAAGDMGDARAAIAGLAELRATPAAVDRLRLLASLIDGEGLDASLDSFRRPAQPGLQTLGLLGVAAIRLGRAPLLDSAVAGAEDVARREPVAGSEARAVIATLRGLDALSRADTATAQRLLVDAYGVLPYDLSSEARCEDAVQWGVLALADLERARGLSAQALSRLDYFTFATGTVPTRALADALRARITTQLRP